MFILLALLTFAVCILISWYLERTSWKDEVVAQPSAALATAGASATALDGLLFHPGHCWAQERSDGLVAVGADDFSQRFIGKVARVIMPRVGTQVRQGDSAWTLVSDSGRRLTQVCPAEGEVVSVNYDLLKQPDLLHRSPYKLGWILQIRPTHLKAALSNLMQGKLAEAWNDAIRAQLTARLSSELGVMAADGGEWGPQFGDALDDVVWQELRADLFPAAEDHHL